MAIGQTEWEAQFVSGLGHPMTGIQIQRRCVDAVDVLAVSKVISSDVVIISDYTLRIDQEFIAEIRKQNLRIIAITTKPQYFEDLGVYEYVQLDLANPLSAISIVAALARVSKTDTEPEINPTGEFIFIGGFGGGTGKTRLAMELAYSLANEQKKILLVDADTYGPSILQLLNFPPTTIGLLDLCRKIERKTNSENFIYQDTQFVSENLNLLPGLTKTSRWVDLRSSALTQLWQFARSEFDYVLVDGGPVLEIDPFIALDTGLPRRNLVTTTALAAATKIVLTSRCDSSSITRLIKGCIENSTQFANRALSAFILKNNSKESTRDIKAAITAHTEINTVGVVVSNPELVHRVIRENTFISAIEPKSELTKTYAAFGQNLLTQISTNPATNSRLQRLFSQKDSLIT